MCFKINKVLAIPSNYWEGFIKDANLVSIPLNPFPLYSKSAADDFENLLAKTLKISIKISV